MDFFVCLNLFALGAMLLLLYTMHHSNNSLSKRVFVALCAGVASGFILHYSYGVESKVIQLTLPFLDIVGLGYIKLLKLIIIPLILVSIVSAIVHVNSNGSLKKISFMTVFLLLATTAISALIGVTIANFFQLDAAVLPHGPQEMAQAGYVQGVLNQLNHKDFASLLLNFLPENIFSDLAGSRPTSTIAVVVIATLIGLSCRKVQQEHPEKIKPFIDLIQATHAMVMQLVNLILSFTPYGIFALMTKVIATSEITGIISLMQFVAASYVAIFCMLAIHLVLVSLTGMSPLYYLSRAMPTLTFAFSSRSSAGTIPLNVKTQVESFGVKEAIANFSASLGATMGQNGCAGIYPAMLAAMVAPSIGVDPGSFHFIIMLVTVCTISSLGVAGVGGGATFAALIVLSVINFPVTIVALLISIEPLIDMARTVLNVSGSMTTGIVTNHWLKHDDSMLAGTAIDDSATPTTQECRDC